MKNVVLLLSVLFILTACCEKKGYETVTQTDRNGYRYEEVTNDPYQARIYTLENGLKIYLSKNTDEPRIQTIIAVRAGSKDDPRDNTGLAHYLEHMMFKGTDHFGTSDWEKEKPLLDTIFNLFEEHKAAETAEARKAIYKQIDALSNKASLHAISNEYDKLAGSLGASGTNAFTSYDMTAYVNEIPSNELDRFLKLEYDRFANLQLRLFHTELETVYEEFNRSQDNGYSLIWNKIFEGLFEKHPYKTSVIGLPEHLKTPSMNSVMAFQKYFYAPNNMAVLMTGDLDFEATVQLVDKHFGQMKPNPGLVHPEPVEEAPLTALKTYEVSTPDQERILVGYRFGGAQSKEALYLDLIGSIFDNGKAGLIDLDLRQKQKVLSLNAGSESLNDYGIFVFLGTPREGQTLEEIGGLIQDEIRKLKNGEFDDSLLKAIINNKKLEVIEITDGRRACFNFLTAFISRVSWKEYVGRIDEMDKITKADIVAFANEFFRDDNYVTVYKRTGENKEKVIVEKPLITAISINRDKESAFATELLAEKPEAIEPVFIDYGEVIKKEPLKEGVDFYYTKNVSNKIYSLNHFVEISNITDKKLALAFSYLPYLGTSGYTPEELKKEMYKLAMYFSANSTAGRSYVNLFGLNETMEQSLKLMSEMINDAAVNQEAYDNLVNDILKQRANRKLSKGQILSGGLVNYAKFGPKSAFTDMLTEAELKAIQPQELIDIIKHFSSYKHGFYYYGPEEKEKVYALLKKQLTPDELEDVPARVEYPELPMDKPAVYFADYDMVQAEIILQAKDQVFDPALLPYQTMFNAYYGGGMNSIVFQEIREARALAYSAYAYVSMPSRKNLSHYVQAYVGTQADKMTDAIDAFRELLSNMPASEKAFEISRETELNNIRSQRLVKTDVFWSYLYLKDLGIDYDYRKPVFEGIQKMTLADIQTYFNEHVKPAQYSVLIIGKKDKINFNYLNKIATVKEITLTELFGY
ncbi:MAG: insulinase family protein [Candidatus Symbiothrix sp.]|nr:insulinase family protein [Candidatus Symbiothrix sp.]